MRDDDIKKPLSLLSRLDEITTNPSTLAKWAQGLEAANMVAGFEAEMLIQDLVWPDDVKGGDADYDRDEDMPSSFSSAADDIEEWFENGNDFNESASLRRALRMLDRDFREWASDRWQDDADDDHWQERLREELASELGVDEDDDLVDETLENKGYAYRSVMRKLKDEYIEDTDSTWEDFLEAKAMRSMGDFAADFGLDWPYTTAKEGSVTPEEVQESFTRYTGLACDVNEDYHGGRSKERFVMEPDSSLSGLDDYGGLELISPPMPLLETLSAMDLVFDWMASYNAKTSTSPPTGFHIGISMPGLNIDSVDKLKLVLMMGDEHVLKQFGRERLSRYAASSYKHIKDNLTQPGFNAEAELAKFRNFLDIQAAKDISSVLSSGLRRDNTINVRPAQGYIEFRSAGGDYIKQRSEIRNTMLRFARAFAIAADPNAERKEYAKKLYALLTSALDAKDNTIEAFASYSSGYLSKEDLRKVIDAYRERKSSGSYAGQKTWNMVDDATGKVLGTIVSDEDGVFDRLRSWAERNNRSAAGLDVVKPGEVKRKHLYRVTQQYGAGNRFDIEAKSPAEALRYAKSRWGDTERPDSDFKIDAR